MIELLLGAVVGSLTTGLGVLTGLTVGRLARRASRVGPYVCQCGHALAYHNDPDDSSCNHVKINFILDDVKCACLGYVGERPLPELDPDAVIRRIGRERS